MIYIFISLLFSLFIYVIKRYQGSIALLMLFPFVLHFFLNVFGVLNLFYFTDVTTVGIKVSSPVINTVALEFFVSYVFLIGMFVFLMHLIGKYKFENDILRYFKTTKANIVNSRLIAFTTAFLIFDAFYYTTPPGLYALSGDIGQAALQKGVFLELKIDSAVPIVGYFVRYLPMITFVHVMLLFIFDKRRRKSFIFLCFVFLIYSFLTLIKSYLFMPLMFYLWALFSTGRFKIRFVIYVFLLLIPILYLTFSGLYSDSSVIFYKIFERVFLVQAEGMFLIRENYKDFDLGAFLYSSPLRHFYGGVVFDPASEIVKRYFGEGNGWVNMNSYYSGQAFLMFSYLYIIMIPFLCLIQALLSRSILMVKLDSGLSNIVLIGVFLMLPLSNNIANLVWFKDFVAVIVLLPIMYLIYKTKKFV